MTATFDTDRALSDAALDTLFRDAHTTYSFTDTPVPSQLLKEIYELVRLAPTATNLHSLRITFLTTPESKARLIPLLNEGNRAKSESAPVVAILSADIDFHENLPLLVPSAPGLRDRFAEESRREPLARNNAWLAAGYFILAARALGLDAGPMGGFDGPGIDAEFHQGTNRRAIMVVNLGYSAPDGQLERAPRLDFSQAVTVL